MFQKVKIHYFFQKYQWFYLLNPEEDLSVLIIAILLSLACPTVLRKCDLRKCVNTFKARSQTSVNKHNPTCGMCYCGMHYILFLLQMIWPRRFYLAGDLTNLYSFIQGSLEWPFSELFSSDVLLWNQYKYIAFNIFTCRILIISFKMLIITGISNETRNELTIYAILCRNVTIFYRQELQSRKNYLERSRQIQ